MKKIDPNNWPDIKKVCAHLEHGDGFMIRETDDLMNDTGVAAVTFKGRDYLGYTSYRLTPAIRKVLKDYEDNYWKKRKKGSGRP